MGMRDLIDGAFEKGTIVVLDIDTGQELARWPADGGEGMDEKEITEWPQMPTGQALSDEVVRAGQEAREALRQALEGHGSRDVLISIAGQAGGPYPIMMLRSMLIEALKDLDGLDVGADELEGALPWGKQYSAGDGSRLNVVVLERKGGDHE